MAEYIDRENYCKNICLCWEGGCEKSKCPIWTAPAADVVTVQHGKWEDGNPICPVCGEDKFKDLDADIWCDWKPDYCPNCGAKMDRGKDNEGGADFTTRR